jgi:hypothetical protein
MMQSDIDQLEKIVKERDMLRAFLTDLVMRKLFLLDSPTDAMHLYFSGKIHRDEWAEIYKLVVQAEHEATMKRMIESRSHLSRTEAHDG